MNSDFLCGTPLFGGIRKEEINGLLKCLNAFTKKYGKCKPEAVLYFFRRSCYNLSMMWIAGAGSA